MNVMTRLLSSPKKARCTCKAGANGYCKLAGALLYAILEFSESGLGQIPPNESQSESEKDDTEEEQCINQEEADEDQRKPKKSRDHN